MPKRVLSPESVERAKERKRKRFETFEERFWERVDKNGPVPEHVQNLEKCWNWSMGTTADGYGVFTDNYVHHYAHRTAWALTNGPIPKGVSCLHKCDNPKCCNPGHLFLGTDQDNSDDKIKRGRHPHGNTHWKKGRYGDSTRVHKLTEAQAKEILLKHFSTRKMTAIAKEFNVDRKTVWNIATGRQWPHLQKFLHE